MATTVARLQAVLGADTGQFDRSMDKSHSKFGKVGKAAGVAGLAIAGGLAVGLTKSVHAAMAAEESQGRLNVAFKNSGLNAADYTKQIAAQLKAGRALGFANSDQRQALGSLIVATHSYKKASQDLSVAQDIARFKNVDLTSATKMLTMAQAGSQRATKQLGLSVQASTKNADAAKLAYRAQRDALKEQFPSIAKMTDAQKAQYYAQRDAIDQQYAGAKAVAQLADKQVTAGKVIDLVRKKLHGQADEYSQTAEGAMARFQAELGNLEGSLGKALLPALTKVSEEAAKMTAWLSAHPRLAKALVIGLAGLAAALIAASVAQTLLNLAVLANPYVAAIVALVAIGVAIYVFRDKLMNVWKWIKDHWPLLAGILAGPIGLAVAEIIKHRNRIIEIFTNLPGQIAGVFVRGWETVKGTFVEAFDWLKARADAARDRVVEIFTNLPGQLAQAFIDGVKVVKDAVTGLFDKVIGWVKGALGIKSPSSVFHGIGQNAIRGFINGVGSMAGLLKKAVVSMAEHAAASIYHGVGGLLHGGGATGSQQNRNIGQQLAARYGWGSGSEWASLDALFNQESGWNNKAKNKSSGAYGIAQALPPTKMPFAAQEGGGSNAAAQIAWGLSYIKSRYGDPNSAWGGYWARGGWYDKGGWLPTGLSLAMNNTGRPERVSPPGGDNVVIPISLGGEHIATVVFDMLRRKAKVFENRNGRPAFGGA